MQTQHTNEKEHIERWLTKAVIELNLCPFAHHPWKNNAVRIVVFSGRKEEDFKAQLIEELNLLTEASTAEIETTLIATPQLFLDFYDFNSYLEHAHSILKREGKKGKIQIASFHPDYRFSGVSPEDKQHFTNRAPYPIFHLIREDSLQKAIDTHPDTESIYQNNIELMRSLSEEKLRELFPYAKALQSR